MSRKPQDSENIARSIEHTWQRTKMFREVFGTPGGKEVLRIILQELCGGDERLTYINGENALYLCGRRDVAHAIRKIIEFDPDKAANLIVKTKRNDGQL